MVILKGMPAWGAGWVKEQYHSGVIIRQPQKSFYVPFRSVVVYYTREISASASLETTIDGTVFSQRCINMAYASLKNQILGSFSAQLSLVFVASQEYVHIAPDNYTSH